MKIKQEIDVLPYIHEQVKSIKDSYCYIYPNGIYDNTRSHPGLQAILGKVNSLLSFLEALQKKE